MTLDDDPTADNRSQRFLEFADDTDAAISDVRFDTRHKIQRLRPPVKAHGGKYYLAKQERIDVM